GFRPKSPANWHVFQHALQADPIVRVMQESQDRHHVFDFLAIVEADSTHDLIWNPAQPERLLQHAALGARSVHDRKGIARPVVLWAQPANFTAHELRFVLLVGTPSDGNGFAIFVAGWPRALDALLILANDVIGGGHDSGARAVIR